MTPADDLPPLELWAKCGGPDFSEIAFPDYVGKAKQVVIDFYNAARAKRDEEVEQWKAALVAVTLKAAAAEARVKEIEQLATPAVVEGFFGLNNRAMRAEKARDLAEARVKDLEHQLVLNIIHRATKVYRDGN